MKYTPYFNAPVYLDVSSSCNQVETGKIKVTEAHIPILMTSDISYYLEKIEMIYSLIGLSPDLSSSMKMVFIPVIRVFTTESSLDVPFFISGYLLKNAYLTIYYILSEISYLFKKNRLLL